MSDIDAACRALAQRLTEGDGRASRVLRRAAFDDDRAALPEPVKRLADKIIAHPNDITDEDVSALRASGLTEDEIFDLVVCVAVGEATREHKGALRALDAAIGRT